MRVVFATTCKNRGAHLAQTLPKNLQDNPRSTFVVLDYASTEDLSPIFKPLRSNDQLRVYRYNNGGVPCPFHVAHAKNMAMRCAMLEGADILVTLDADNFAGKLFDEFAVVALREPGVFAHPDHLSIQQMPWGPGSERPLRGFAGRLAVRAQDFVKAGGYDEAYDTWRGEDIDFNARMGRMGYAARFIENGFLGVIPHNAEVRFREYPHARIYDREGGWKIDGHHTNTVVNYGQIGVGSVYRDGQLIELPPLPTRVFGIGLHKTATTSLHKAFQTLGFDSLHWGKGEAPTIWQEVAAAGRSQTLERFYAASDLPIPLLYKQLDKAYPGSKFILTVRDEAKWLKSVERLWDPKYNPTRWQWDVWPISNRLHKALYGRVDFDAQTMLERYLRHNAEVRHYFRNRPEDLLVLNMENDGWSSLCAFLNKAIPAESYPREYVTREVRELCSS